MLNIKQKAKTFFESLPSYNDGYLEVGGGHSIYYEEYGNPNGKPILFLHGGPGAGFSNSHKGFFDPKIFRVVFFDQRGSGKSIPYAEIKNNDTDLLLSDIEALRVFLNIEKWLLFGGSWGSTLALLYGIKFPEKCLGFILRGIFLGSKSEVNWFLYDIKKVLP
jgi:proline iminopeptidase